MSVFQIVYRSRAAEGVDDAAVRNILKTSRRLNKKVGITGVLIKRGDAFVQLLEGDERKVRTTFGRIQQDDRHFEIKTLIECNSERIYKDWDMAFIDEADKNVVLNDLIPFLDDAASLANDSPEAIVPLLRTFSEKIDPAEEEAEED